MHKNNIHFISEKAIKIHSIIEERENCLISFRHNNLCKEEILNFASKCLELKRNLGLLLKDDYADLKDKIN